MFHANTIYATCRRGNAPASCSAGRRLVSASPILTPDAAAAGSGPAARPAGLRRRLLSLVYEVVLLLAVLVIASFPVAPIVQALSAPWGRHFQQVYLLAVAGWYLVWFWTHGGQTLAMKTWRIRLISASGGSVGSRQAWLRYGLALLGLAACGLGLLWALWDRDGQFLHDRLAGTRLVESTALDAPQRHGGTEAKQHEGG